MADLLYYKSESNEFQDEFKKTLSSQKAVSIIIHKLLKHFKLGNLFINFTSGRNHSNAGRFQITINIAQLNFGVICHELAHTYQARKLGFRKGDRWHTKKHKKIMKRMLNYCRKKNWFEDELKRRLAPKEVKPEPTKDELRLKLIERLQDNCRRYQTKLKMYSNKFKKVQRKIIRLNKGIIMGNPLPPAKVGVK